MREQGIVESDVEYVLRSPLEVENRKTMQNYSPDSKIYIKGVDKDGNRLRLGISAMEGRRIVVTSARRVLDDRIPLMKEDFISFINDYLGEGNKIIYTRHVRERMDKLVVGEEGIERMLRHPVKIVKRSDRYYVIGQGVRSRPLRLIISFDGRIRLITMDTSTSTK